MILCCAIWGLESNINLSSLVMESRQHLYFYVHIAFQNVQPLLAFCRAHRYAQVSHLVHVTPSFAGYSCHKKYLHTCDNGAGYPFGTSKVNNDTFETRMLYAKLNCMYVPHRFPSFHCWNFFEYELIFITKMLNYLILPQRDNSKGRLR